MEYTIYLIDPAGGGVTESANVMIVRPSIVREIGKISVAQPVILQPGVLGATQGALNLLDESGVLEAYKQHLQGIWWGNDREAKAENNAALITGGTIYNVDRARKIMCITYWGDNTMLILSEEY